VRTEAIEQSGLNDRRSVNAADDWVADDGNHEVNSVKCNANAFATVNFPPAMFDEIADIDTAGSLTARVASTIKPAFATRMTRPHMTLIIGRDRDSLRAAFVLRAACAAHSAASAAQIAASAAAAKTRCNEQRNNPGHFVPGRSHIQSRHRFS
jgi:hypothetical protein